MSPSLFLVYRWYAPKVVWWPSESWAAVSASSSPSVTSKVPCREYASVMQAWCTQFIGLPWWMAAQCEGAGGSGRQLPAPTSWGVARVALLCGPGETVMQSGKWGGRAAVVLAARLGAYGRSCCGAG